RKIISASQDMDAALARRKVTAAESGGCYRVAQSHGRTSLLHAMQRTTVCSALEESRASKTRVRRIEPHSRRAVSRGPSLLRASRKLAPNFLSPFVCQGRARSPSSPAPENRLFCTRDGRIP